ncbi:helicase-related protein [Halorubellus sp. PRR65]|uniref:DEAD/DEAH box helicase n=1 Tax=Halorubellus sp. PRR65 TaxID=3098148 RepID=UPI002B25B70A|nr:helicase-related protein [Halorubellus sp. PRR65]
MSADNTFKPGDRVSYFDDKGSGRGTIVKIEGNLLHIHTDDGRIVEQSSDLPMVSKKEEFESGELVSFPGGEGEILKIEPQPSGADLLFVNTESNGLKTIPADQKGIEKQARVEDRIRTGQFDSANRFDLRSQATRLDMAYRFDRFLSLSGNRIDVTPHQVEAAYEILNSHDRRYLIGDEVGLGKTIEAGIIIEELLARGASRALIVTPASLKRQWKQEMADKFDRDFTIYDRETVNGIKAMTSENVWEVNDLIITSIDFVKQAGDDGIPEDFEKASWDVAVFDEAHHLTARRRSDGRKEPTNRYKVGESVSEKTDALLFLTGTPHKGKHDQFYFMMDLLEPYRFEDEHDISPEKLDELMIRRTKDNPNMVHSDGTPMFPEKEINTLSVEFTEEEDQLYEDITNYLRNEYRLGEDQESRAAGFSMVIYQKRLVSSIRSIQKSLEKRAATLRGDGRNGLSTVVRSMLDQYRKNPETLTDQQRERVEEELQEVSGDQSEADRQQELETVMNLIERARAIDEDSKAAKLKSAIEKLLAEDPDEKVLIFTEYTDTLEYLRDEVLDAYDVAEIHGGMSQKHRQEQVEKFRRGANLMLATDAAREGLNLQFAHIMINYDLPWNPIRIDQRMGRLHRYGQDQKVNIYNLFIEDTRESDILQNLTVKIDRIEEDLGMSSDVLGMVLEGSDFDLEDRIMEAVVNNESGRDVVDNLEEIIEERKEAVETLQENFLIEDQFNESDLEEVQEVIEDSKDEYVGQVEVQRLLELFIDENDGAMELADDGHPEGDVYKIQTPSVIELQGDEVLSSYPRVTFDQEVAKDDSGVTFLSVNHPLVRGIVNYCLDGQDWIDGKTTAKQAGDPKLEPGILCNFRLGHVTGDGSEETEVFESIYVTASGSIREDSPEALGPLAHEDAADHPVVAEVMGKADDLVEEARQKAQTRVQQMAREAENERKTVVAEKREHAARYFENAIATWENRLADYQQKLKEGKEMRGNIGRANNKLEELRQERKATFERLDEEEVVYPETNELVNAAVVIPSTDW